MIECGYGILLIQSVLYPFIYPFRIEKGRIGMFIETFGIMGISSLFWIVESLLDFHKHESWYFIIILPIALIILIFFLQTIDVYLFKKTILSKVNVY